MNELMRSALLPSITPPAAVPLRSTLADVEILGAPLGLAPVRRAVPIRRRPMVRPTLGHTSILGGPVEVLGEPMGPPQVGRIGWYWDQPGNVLIAYVTTDRGTASVRIPMSRVWAAFASAAREVGIDWEPEVAGFRPTVAGLFSKIKKSVKKVAKKVTPRPVQRLAAAAQRRLAPVAKLAVQHARKAGKTALVVARSPAFGAVMGAMAVAPPLTAVGAAGLAANRAAAMAHSLIQAGKAAKAGIQSASAAVQAARSSPQGFARALDTVARNAAALPSRGTPSARILQAALRSRG